MLHTKVAPNASKIARMFCAYLRLPGSRKRPDESFLTFRSLRTVCACLLLAACATVPEEGGEGIDADPKILTLKKQSEQDPSDARAHYGLGNALFDATRYVEAITAYQRAIEADPAFADAYTNLGLTHRKLNNPALAIENYEISLSLQPNDSATLRNMIIALRAGSTPERALDYLFPFVRLRPDDATARSDLAASLFALGRYQEASEHYRFLLKLNAADLNQQFNLGFCYFIAEDWDSALMTWAKIVERDSNHGRAHRGMARAYVQKGEYESAWKSVRECERLGFPLSVDFLSELRNTSGHLGPNESR